jgi:hypothetical protein
VVKIDADGKKMEGRRSQTAILVNCCSGNFPFVDAVDTALPELDDTIADIREEFASRLERISRPRGERIWPAAGKVKVENIWLHTLWLLPLVASELENERS